MKDLPLGILISLGIMILITALTIARDKKKSQSNEKVKSE